MTDEEARRAVNAWYDAYRRAIVGWSNLATCVRAAIAALEEARPAHARRILSEALEEHSPDVR